MQVFLDTYAMAGIHGDVAREVLANCSPQAFAPRLANASRRFTLAEQGGRLVAFAEVDVASPCPLQASAPVELVRLYVQQPFQRQGIGRELLRHAEGQALAAASGWLWLSAWVGNERARAFYAALQYRDIGSIGHVIEGRSYENRVFVGRPDCAEDQPCMHA
jgi:GNAT superfamily N-acetyltransferase